MLDGVIDRRANQPLRTLARNRLDADARSLGEANLVDAHLGLEKLDDLLRLRRFSLPFDTGVNVFGVLAEDHHVDFFRRLDRTRHAVEVAHRTQAYVQIEELTQRDVERPD